MLKENDIVQIPKYKKTINEFGRIVKIQGDTIFVSNMSMPFYGTLAYTPFHYTEIKLKEAA